MKRNEKSDLVKHVKMSKCSTMKHTTLQTVNSKNGGRKHIQNEVSAVKRDTNYMWISLHVERIINAKL